MTVKADPTQIDAQDRVFVLTGAGVSATNVTTTYDVTVTGTTTFDIAAQVGTLPLCVDGPGQAPPQKH